MAEIVKVIGREILDSRGNPTVEGEERRSHRALQRVSTKRLSFGIKINPAIWARVPSKQQGM
jgi:enolase